MGTSPQLNNTQNLTSDQRKSALDSLLGEGHPFRVSYEVDGASISISRDVATRSGGASQGKEGFIVHCLKDGVQTTYAVDSEGRIGSQVSRDGNGQTCSPNLSLDQVLNLALNAPAPVNNNEREIRVAPAGIIEQQVVSADRAKLFIDQSLNGKKSANYEIPEEASVYIAKLDPTPANSGAAYEISIRNPQRGNEFTSSTFFFNSEGQLLNNSYIEHTSREAFDDIGNISRSEVGNDHLRVLSETMSQLTNRKEILENKFSNAVLPRPLVKNA